jgi:hypothetical protein
MQLPTVLRERLAVCESMPDARCAVRGASEDGTSTMADI